VKWLNVEILAHTTMLINEMISIDPAKLPAQSDDQVLEI
jgi:hypothetical protein